MKPPMGVGCWNASRMLEAPPIEIRFAFAHALAEKLECLLLGKKVGEELSTVPQSARSPMVSVDDESSAVVRQCHHNARPKVDREMIEVLWTDLC